MLKKYDRNECTAEISRQAARWFLQLKDPRRVFLAEGWQLLLWLMRSRGHVREYILIRRLDDQLARAFQRPRDRSRVTHVNWWQGSALKPAERKGWGHIAGWGVAAMVLLMLPTVFFLGRMHGQKPEGTIATAAGESGTRRLEDGSMVSLDAGSALRVEFTDERRDVHLFQGQAMFNVAMDRKRPFVVNTWLAHISAVDSKFAVRIDSTVEVEVYEGAVEVSGRGAKAGAPVITVKRGEIYRVPVDRFRAILADSHDRWRAALNDA